MRPEIVCAILSLCGTAIGSLGGIITTSKNTNYRLDQLEKKVDKHNNVIERVFHLEDLTNETKEDIQQLQSDVKDNRTEISKIKETIRK